MNDSVRSDPDHLRTELFLATPLRPELRDLGLRAVELELAAEPRPYLWFGR